MFGRDTESAATGEMLRRAALAADTLNHRGFAL
jgi:hypothetical protein